jgi:hypothetical protein
LDIAFPETAIPALTKPDMDPHSFPAPAVPAMAIFLKGIFAEGTRLTA